MVEKIREGVASSPGQARSDDGRPSQLAATKATAWCASTCGWDHGSRRRKGKGGKEDAHGGKDVVGSGARGRRRNPGMKPGRRRKGNEDVLTCKSDGCATRYDAELNKNPVDGFSAGLVDDSNVFEWQVSIIGPPDTMYEGGFFNALMTFPDDYPNSPPTVRFTSEMWHPNIYPDGRVCISILHNAGDDPNGYEMASERWSPVHTVETILLSIISMLSSPNDESPANLDAAIDFRDKPEEFKKKVRRTVRKSQEMM